MTPTAHTPDHYLAAQDAAVRLVEETCRYLNLSSPAIRLAAVLDRFNGSHFIKGSDGRVAYASPNFEKQFSDGAELTGLRESDFMPQEVRSLTDRTDDLVLKQGRTASFSFSITSNDGIQHSFQTQRVPFISPANEIVGMFGVSRKLATTELDSASSGAVAEISVIRRQMQLLDDRERELAQLLSHGAINKQLASHFGVSIRSVENWRRTLLTKLDLETIPQLTRWIVRLEDYGFLPVT